MAAGLDPAALKRKQKAEQAAAKTIIRIVAEECVAKQIREGRAESTVSKLNWLLSLAYPDLGERPIAEIKAAEILVPLRRLENRGHLETARRLRSTWNPRIE